jgi:hypothetical protein
LGKGVAFTMIFDLQELILLAQENCCRASIVTSTAQALGNWLPWRDVMTTPTINIHAPGHETVKVKGQYSGMDKKGHLLYVLSHAALANSFSQHTHQIDDNLLSIIYYLFIKVLPHGQNLSEWEREDGAEWGGGGGGEGGKEVCKRIEIADDRVRRRVQERGRKGGEER